MNCSNGLLKQYHFLSYMTKPNMLASHYQMNEGRHGHDSQSRISAHRRPTRAEIRPRGLLERAVLAGRIERAGHTAAPAALAEPNRHRPRAGRRFFLLRSGARHELYPG